MKKLLSRKLLTFIFLLIGFSYFAQEQNQQRAFKELKAGQYKVFSIYGTKYDFKYDISFTYDNIGYVETVSIGKQTYHIPIVKDYGSDLKVGYDSHFENDKGSIVTIDGRIYLFTLLTSGELNTVKSVMGKSSPNEAKAFAQLRTQIEYMRKAEERANKKLYELKTMNNPEEYYSKIYSESEGYKVVKSKGSKGLYGVIDANNKIIITPQYEEINTVVSGGVIGVKDGGKYGCVNMKNRIVLMFEFDYIFPAKNGYISTRKGDDYQVYNTEGKLIHKGLNNSYATRKSIYVKKGNDFGIIDENGKIEYILKGVDYDKIIPDGENYITIKDNKYGVITLTGKVLLEPILDKIWNSKNNIAPIKYNGKEGYYKYGTGFITEVIYDEVFPLSFDPEDFDIKHKGAKGSVDKDGNIIWKDGHKTNAVTLSTPTKKWREKYTTSEPTLNGEYSLVMSKDDKFGFVNESGTIVIPCTYSSASNFENNISIVSEGNRYGAINSKGSKIIKTLYDQVSAPKNGKITAFLSGDKYFFDLKGNLIEKEVKRVVRREDKLVSFYYDYKGTESGVSPYGLFTFKYQGSFAMDNGNEVRFGSWYDKDSEDKTKYQTIHFERDCDRYVESGNVKFTTGTGVSDNAIVLTDLNSYAYYQIQSEKLVKVKSLLVPENFQALATINIGSGRVASLWWGNNKDLIYTIWDYKANKLYKRKTCSNFTFPDKQEDEAVFLDANKSLNRVVIGYNSNTSRMYIEVIEVDNLDEEKNLKPIWNKEIEFGDNTYGNKYNLKGCRFNLNDEPVLLVTRHSDKNEIGLLKYSKDGKTNISNKTTSLPVKYWTREGGKKLTPTKWDRLFFLARNNYYLLENEFTGQLFIFGNLNNQKINYSFGNISSNVYGNNPFVIGIDEDKMLFESFDFLNRFEENGKLLTYPYRTYANWSEIKQKKPHISTDRSGGAVLQYYEEATSGFSTFYWRAFFNSAEGSSSVSQGSRESASNNSSSNSNSSSSSSTSSSSSSSSSTTNSNAGPQYSGSVTIKNDTGEKLYIWFKSGGGYVNNGSTKTAGCYKGQKVYAGSSSSSSSKKFVFEITPDMCGKTIKLSKYL